MTGFGGRRAGRGWRPRSLAGLVAVACTVVVSGLLPRVAWAAADPAIGAAGTDVALPPTASAVTVSGSGTFAGLTVTVNQTALLNDQAISVTWTTPTPSTFAGSHEVVDNYLQIMQCWGDDPSGPPPEQCEFGANQIATSTPAQNPGLSNTRIITEPGWGSYQKDLSQGYVDPKSASGLVWKPFRSVDGTITNAEVGDPNQVGAGQGGWLNPKFDLTTTNEDDYALATTDGAGHGQGSELFHVDTAPYAPGLGCGAASEVHPDGSTTVPQCWLVIVPRGSAASEDAPAGTPGTATVLTSPLRADAWAHRIAIPLSFNPVATACAIGAHERDISGGEMAAPAIDNWGPQLCATPGLPPYNYSYGSEDLARASLLSTEQGAPGMAVISRPIDPSTVDPSNPVTYAPLSLSGLVIGFNVDRVLVDSATAPAAEAALDGLRVQHINLTPRLVAKLLTESYQGLFDQGGVLPSGPGYGWLAHNPIDMFADPDFIQYNPEFKYLTAGDHRSSSSLVVEESTSDATYELWNWVLADPEASAWLAGAPDNATNPKLSGMTVNPYYSTNAYINPQGGFASPTPETFPKSDPYCYQSPATWGVPAKPVDPVCMTDVMPYANTLNATSQETAVGNDAAKLYLPLGLDWANQPAIAGTESMLAVTDSASAALSGIQTANLSRAGDDGATRAFVAPDAPGLLAGEQAMVPSPVPAVLQPDPTTTNSGAYPLTMLTYAAVTPGSLDATARHDYAAFVNFAVTSGQTPGLQYGDLPPGYVPLPASLVAQAKAAVLAIGPPPATPAPTTTVTATTHPGSSTTAAPAPAPATAATTTTATTGAPKPAKAVGPTTTRVPPKTALLPPAKTQLVTSRTPATGVGFVRYTLPIALIIGILAAVGVRLLSERRRPKRPDPPLSDASPSPPAALPST